MPPNIIFFLIDGLRADQFYGNNRTCKTPNIDYLKKRGTYFTQAISSADGTFTSLNSIFTGNFPFRNGIRTRKILLKENNFLDVFIKNGYKINGLVPNMTSFHQLVSYFQNNDKTYNYFENNDKTSGPSISTESLSTGLTDKIINFLKNRAIKMPWLYYAHLCDLHPIREKNIPPGIENFNIEKFGASIYERVISSIDHQLGKIFQYVDFDNTILVLTADHGERIPYGDVRDIDFEPKLETVVKLGKKTLPKSTQKIGGKFLSKLRYNVGKRKSKSENKDLTNIQIRSRDTYFALSLFDEMLHIPLFLATNSINPKIIPDFVRSIDIFPTLCDLVKINFEQTVHGRSLITLIQGNKIEEKPAYLHTTPYQKPHPTDSVGIRTSNYKYFRSSHNIKENVNLYDLKNDPFENNNIAETNVELVKQFEKILTEMQNDNTSQDENQENTEEQQKIEFELKKMGYI
tara:strand:+ start:3284 stop:4666 length:1383 start_codon:yes stop_codon:yes gene_type:complete